MKKHEKGQYFRDFIVFLKDPHPNDFPESLMGL